jgi:WxcM-like protein
MLSRALPFGIKMLPVSLHEDGRGTLYAFEEGNPLPFTPVRLFIIRDVPPREIRAQHAVSCHEFLWMIAGSCTLNADNGSERASLRLQADGNGALVSSGVWMELCDFGEDAILSVLASRSYADTRYFTTPQPGIISRFD